MSQKKRKLSIQVQCGRCDNTYTMPAPRGVHQDTPLFMIEDTTCPLCNNNNKDAHIINLRNYQAN